jgi:hypothetical protein
VITLHLSLFEVSAMVELFKIVHSQGIRILKAFIEKAKLEDCNLDLTLVEQRLLLISSKLKLRAD